MKITAIIFFVIAGVEIFLGLFALVGGISMRLWGAVYVGAVLIILGAPIVVMGFSLLSLRREAKLPEGKK